MCVEGWGSVVGCSERRRLDGTGNIYLGLIGQLSLGHFRQPVCLEPLTHVRKLVSLSSGESLTNQSD